MTESARMKEFMCEERGCIHKVVIYKEGCKYRVEPGRLVVHPGAKIAIISLVQTPATVVVWFPDGVRARVQLPVPYGQPTVVVADANPGVFPYSVYVSGDHGTDFAEGGSSPRIIVADP